MVNLLLATVTLLGLAWLVCWVLRDAATRHSDAHDCGAHAGDERDTVQRRHDTAAVAASRVPAMATGAARLPESALRWTALDDHQLSRFLTSR